MKGYKDPRNTTCDGHLIEWDPWHVEEESRTQMLGTTRCETVLVHSTREASESPVCQRGHRASGVRNSEHPHIPSSRGLPFVRLMDDLSNQLCGHRNHHL